MGVIETSFMVHSLRARGIPPQDFGVLCEGVFKMNDTQRGTCKWFDSKKVRKKRYLIVSGRPSVPAGSSSACARAL